MKTLLLIDPGEANRQLVSALFSYSDVNVQAVVTVREGVEAALRTAPALILTEFLTAERGSGSVLDELKRHPELENVPVIVWAAEGIGDARSRTLEGGGRFVPKSSPPLVLVQAILGELDLRKPPRAAPESVAHRAAGDPTAA